MKKIIKSFYYIYIILILIFPVRITPDVYLGSLVAILLSLFIFIELKVKNIKFNFKLSTLEKTTGILCALYIIVQVFQIILMKGDIIFHCEKIGCVLLFIASMYYFKVNKAMFKELLGFLKIIIVVVVGTWIIFYLLRISRIDIIGSHITVIGFDLPEILYGEIRFEWLTRHKSEFAILCLFLSMYIINLCKSNRYKFILLSLCAIGIFLSKSNTTLIIYVLAIVIIFLTKLILLPKDIKLRVVLLNLYVLLSGIVIFFSFPIIQSTIAFILEGRNISTLGSRSFIWGAAINTLKNNLLGYGSKVGVNFMVDPIYSFTTYSNAHNTYLQECLESGVIGGLIFVFITIFILIIIFKSRYENGILFIAIILTMQMDIGMFGINIHLMYLLVATIIASKHECYEMKESE